MEITGITLIACLIGSVVWFYIGYWVGKAIHKKIREGVE